MESVVHEADVCIVGGGPAGMLLGLILAHQGIEVVVLESHQDFHREYRGELLQPRFIQLMHHLNLLEGLEQLPHARISHGSFYHADKEVAKFEFGAISSQFPYALWTPQTLLLEQLFHLASQFQTFTLHFHAPVKHLLMDGERVIGAVADNGKEIIEVKAKVTVGADGRTSAVRRLGGFELEYERNVGEVVWFNAPRPPGWNEEFRICINDGLNHMFLPKYPDLVQVGLCFPTGKWKEVKESGLEALCKEVSHKVPLVAEYIHGVMDFSPFVLLPAKSFMVRRWAKDGCLLIGDAAHCSSPVGALGVSLAVTTAVVAADVLLNAFGQSKFDADVLNEVQARREAEIRHVHKFQDRAGKVVFGTSPRLAAAAPLLLSVAARTPLLGRIQRSVLALSENALAVDHLAVRAPQ